MSTIPTAPRLLKGGIVLVDPRTLAVRSGGVVALQYNPDSISRTLQAVTIGGEGQDGADAMRFKGPPVETIRLEAEIDATDQLQANNSTAARFGIQPQLAVLELVVYPQSAQMQVNRTRAANGTLEIIPMEAPLALFVWSRSKIVPVIVTEFSVTEEAFDTELNPIRAKVSLGLRVLNTNDLGFEHRGSDLFSRYHREKEDLAAKVARSDLSVLGLESIT